MCIRDRVKVQNIDTWLVNLVTNSNLIRVASVQQKPVRPCKMQYSPRLYLLGLGRNSTPAFFLIAAVYSLLISVRVLRYGPFSFMPVSYTHLYIKNQTLLRPKLIPSPVIWNLAPHWGHVMACPTGSLPSGAISQPHRGQKKATG